MPWWSPVLVRGGKALVGVTSASLVTTDHTIFQAMGSFGLILLILKLIDPGFLWPWLQDHLTGGRKTRSMWRESDPLPRTAAKQRTLFIHRMAIGRNSGMLLDFGAFREKLESMSDLPQIASLRLRYGEVPLGLPKSESASRLEEISYDESSLPPEVREVLQADSVMTLGDKYGDPFSGNPIMPEFLKITFADASVKNIEVYNLGILMFTDNSEETRRLFRIFTRIKESGGGPISG